ncbi:MAG TPA: ATP-binding cassette domain-containing protein, partial [Gammaproteobacteria bacterium]|nr:ATP-binding cassette domain-containing protein [Gammaproteobacteria bacterium]
YERLHQREILSNYELIQNTSESTRNGSLYSNTAVILTGFVGGVLVIYHYITVGGLAASILVAGRLMLPVTKFITYLEKKKELGTAMNDLNFIMSFKNEYAPGLEKLDQFHGEITLTNASFKFPNSEKYAFQDINLKIKENETLILHGPLGSGKSTLLLLISSLYKPTEGSVLIDGINIQKLDLDDYRSKTAYISESGDLFTGTIMENLTLFEVDKYASQARELAKILGLHEIIEAMPQSYDTMVGTGTVDLLSKGHKQIVLLIRALVDNPKVILFDEANIALDVDSDVRLRKYLLSQKGKCTMVLVTHRPSLIAMGDKHIKLENGKISEITWQ